MKGNIFQIFTVCMMILLSSCNPAGTVNPQHTPISIFTKSITIDSVKASSGTATIAWSGSTDAQSYTVKYGTASGVYTTTVSTNATSPLTITGLTNGNSYFILVTEVQKSGKTVDATPVGVTPIDSFTLSSITASNQQATLVFPTVVGASAYTVKYGTSNGVYTNIASNTATSPYTVTGLTNGVTYYFMVTATNANNGSQDATSSLAAIPTAPTTLPSGVIASSSTAGQIVLNWNAATAATSYNVKRSTFSGGGYSTVGSLVVGTTFTDTTVNGTRYFYVVTSNAPGGESAISNEANSMSIANFAPPITGTVTTSGQVNLTWTGPTGATAYDVKYRIAGTVNYSTFASNITASSSNVTSLSNGTAYEFIVAAKNAYSGTLNSNTVTATTLSSASVATSALSESAKIDWTAVFGSTSYDIMYGSVSGTYTTTLVNQNQATGVTIAGLTYIAPGPTYYVKVRANTAAGYVDSAEYSVTVKPPVPTAPVVTTVVSNVVNMSWPVAGLGTLRYSVLRNGTALTACTSIVARTCIDATAVAGTTYTYTVSATNEGGTSPASSNIVAKTIASFNITNVVLDPNVANQATVTWPSPVGADAAAYVVKYTTVRGDYTTGASTTAACTSSPCIVTGLTQAVYFMVTATNATGAAKNATSDFAGLPVGAPAAPTLVKGTNLLTITWGNVTGATSYDLLYTSTVDATTYTIYNVSSGYVLTGLGYGSDQAPTNYTVYVRANNLNGGVLSAGSPSTVNYPTFMRPGSPTATGGASQITIGWGASIGQGTITYTVKRSTAYNGTYTDVANCIDRPAVELSCIDSTVANGTTYFYVVYANESLIAAPFTQTNTSAYSSTIVYAQSILMPTINTPATDGLASALSVTYTGVAGGQSYTLSASGGTIGAVDLSWPQSTAAGALATAHYTGLTAGTTYSFSLTVTNTISPIVTINGVVTTLAPKTTTVTSATVIGVPMAAFTVTSFLPNHTPGGTGAAEVNWAASAGATSYDIMYDSVAKVGAYPPNPIPTVLTSPAMLLQSTPWNVAGTAVTMLPPTYLANAIYEIRVRAKNAYGSVDSTNLVDTGVTTFAGVNTNPTVTPTGGTFSVTLNWTNITAATSYMIYKDSVLLTTVGAGVVTYTNTLVTAGVHNYQVYAVDFDSGNLDGNTVTATSTGGTINTSGILAFTGVNTSAAALTPVEAAGPPITWSYNISWTNIAAANLYNIYDSASATPLVPIATSAAGTSSKAISGLNDGVTHTFKVHAVDIYGNVDTNTATVSHVANAALLYQLDTFAGVNTDPAALNIFSPPLTGIWFATVTWIPIANADFYDVYINGALYASLGAGTSSVPVAPLVDGVIYTFSVKARKNGLTDSHNVSVTQRMYQARPPTKLKQYSPALLGTVASSLGGMANGGEPVGYTRSATFKIHSDDAVASALSVGDKVTLYADSGCVTPISASPGVVVPKDADTGAYYETLHPYATVNVTFPDTSVTGTDVVYGIWGKAAPVSGGGIASGCTRLKDDTIDRDNIYKDEHSGVTGYPSINQPANADAVYYYHKCQSGWVPVPGRHTEWGETNPFCVMKYEAKYVTGVATSQAANYPWTVSSAQAAKDACIALNSGGSTNFDLMTVPEHMAIARNLESVASNWASGVVGGSYMYNGNSQACGLGLLTADGSDQACGASGDPARRTHNLADNNVIWDFAGNAAEISEWNYHRPGTSYDAADPGGGAFAWSVTFPGGWASDGPGQVATPIATQRLGQLSNTWNAAHVQILGGSYLTPDLVTGIYTKQLTSYTGVNSAGSADIGFRCIDRLGH